ncbi:MAG: ester cyclase [Chryseolinea sp.]
MKILFYGLAIVSIIVLTGCSSKDDKVDLEANRQVVRNYHDVWSNGQLGLLDTIISPDFVCHFIAGLEWKGIEGAKNSISNHKKAFPDWTEEIVDIIAEGDKVVTRYKSSGTHQGNFNGLDSTGNKVTIYETSIYRIANGKIIEQWGFPDEISLRNQLKTK